MDDMFGEPKRMPDFLVGLESMNSSGKPVMYRPQVMADPPVHDPATLPLLLYLPGIDGTGLAAYRQFPGLAARFDLRALYLPPSDRSSFEDIVAAAQAQLEAELTGGDPLRPVYLLGESFGCLVALALAQRSTAVDRVILVNPATSFSDSVWPLAGPLLTALPSQVYNSLPIALSPILTNPINVALRAMPGRGALGGLPPSPVDAVSSAAWALVDLLPELGALRSVLPPATLAHRLNLLQQGCRNVNASLSQVQQRVLLLVGEADRVIPSATEGPRLKRALPRAYLRTLPGRSHAMLQEAGLDLAAILDEEDFYVRRRRLTSAPSPSGGEGGRAGLPASGAAFGRPAPVELPTPKEVARALDDGGLTTLRRLVSPVYFSTDPDTGRLVQGLGAVPLGRPGKPVILVGNHQLFAPDMPLMVAQFLQERDVLVRGLAHPVAIQGMSAGGAGGVGGAGQAGPNNAFGAQLKSFGAVPVSGASLHRLLAAGETVLLYPGGAREALKYKDESYQLIWPDKPEFVRMAARFGATIVPFGAVGAEDAFNQVLDGRDLAALPVVGDWLRSRQGQVPQARRGVTASENNIDSFITPLLTFNPPSRYYFLFGKPIDAGELAVSDREGADRMYRDVRGAVADAIDYLLRKRDSDPNKDLLKRLMYEATWGWGRQAPTFEP